MNEVQQADRECNDNWYDEKLHSKIINTVRSAQGMSVIVQIDFDTSTNSKLNLAESK